MGRKATLLLLAAGTGCFLFYLSTLVRSPLTTATSLETTSPAQSSSPPLGLVVAVENPDLEKAGDFTVRPWPLRCSLRGIRVLPPMRGRLSSIRRPGETLFVKIVSDTSSVPETGVELAFRLAQLTSLRLESSEDSTLYPVDFMPALDRTLSTLEDADSTAPYIFHVFSSPARRPFLYPFDEYVITLSTRITFQSVQDTTSFAPYVSVVCDRSAWTHNVSFVEPTNTTATSVRVTFKRSGDVRFVALLALSTLLLLILAIPFQRDTGSVLEVSFSFLLGLWGIRGVIVPTSIRFPTIIDSALLGLFALFTLSVLLRLILNPLAGGQFLQRAWQSGKRVLSGRSGQATSHQRSLSVNKKLHDVMYGLFYPAVLGAGLVGLSLHGAGESSVGFACRAPAMQLGVLFLLYFTASFAASFGLPKYGASAFLLDLGEVFLMFLAFYLLRLFERSVETPRIHAAYLVLLVSILWQFLWRWRVGKNVWARAYLRLGAAVCAIVGFRVDTSSCLVHSIIALALATIILLYLFILKPKEG